MSSPSLTTVLKPFAEKGYANLFSKNGGYLAHEKGGWVISRYPPKDLPAYYSSLSASLIQLQPEEYRNISKLDAFVQRFNSCRSLAEFPKPPALIPAKSKNIFFNSKHATQRVFSNFYQTLVLFPDHIHHDKMTIYPSSENAYQAHKVALLYRLKQLALPNPTAEQISAQPIDPDLQDQLNVLAKALPLNSKLFAQQLSDGAPNTDQTARLKASLMEQIVTKKIADNLVLAFWLKSTKDLDLIEDSSDRFWGAKDPNDKTLKKNMSLPIDKNSRNVLGRILMQVRKQLPEPKK